MKDTFTSDNTEEQIKSLDALAGGVIEGDSVHAAPLYDAVPEEVPLSIADRLDKMDDVVNDAEKLADETSESIDAFRGSEYSSTVERRVAGTLRESYADLLSTNNDAKKLLQFLDVDIDEADTIAKALMEDDNVRARMGRKILGQLHASIVSNQLDADQQRMLSRVANQMISVDGYENMSYRALKMAGNESDAITSQNLSDYLVGYGTETGSGRSIAKAWRIDKAGDAVSVDSQTAKNLIRIEMIGESQVGRANNITWNSVEAMNMQLIASGIDEDTFMEAAKRVAPDLVADNSAKDILRGIAVGNRDMDMITDGIKPGITSDWMTPIKSIVGNGSVEGRAISAQTDVALDPFEMLHTAAMQLKYTGDVEAGSEEAFRSSAFAVRNVINGMNVGDTSDEIMTVGSNFKRAMKDPLLAAGELVRDFGAKSPTLAKMAVGAIAIGGISAAYRALSSQPYRTEEFLQYDHPGSAGIARVASNEQGYAASSGRMDSTPPPAGQVRQDTAFKGHKATITVRDNIDTTSPNDVRNMIDRM